MQQGSQAPAAVPQIMVCNKAGCVEVFIRWKPAVVSYSNTPKYTQVRKTVLDLPWPKGNISSREKKKSFSLDKKRDVNKWLNGTG